MSNAGTRIVIAALAGMANTFAIRPVDAADATHSISRKYFSEAAKTLSLAPTVRDPSGDSPNRQRKLVKIHQRAALKARHRGQCR